MAGPPSSPKEFAAATARVGLDAFLRSGRRLDLTPKGPPRVSALMLVCGRAEVTFACLRSLAPAARDTPFELIVVDNASADATAALLDRVDGAVVIRNATNVGFPAGANQAAARAAGEYLLFVNNDTEVLGRSVDAAADYLSAHPDVGAVGGRVVLMDGTLQEAGVQIKADGWTHQYARGWPPDHPAVLFERDPDYVSFVFALVRRSAFEAAGGLDERYSPGYFEDPDLSVRVRRAGWRIAYLPEIVVLHHENATSAGTLDIEPLVARNHAVFAARHADWLAEQLPPGEQWSELGRRADDSSLHVLLLTGPGDAADLGRLVRALEALDAGVTVGFAGGGAAPAGLPATVEAVPVASAADVDGLLTGRPRFFDLAVFAGPPPSGVPGVLDRHGVAWADRAGGRFRLAGA